MLTQDITSFCAVPQLAGLEFDGADAANFLQGQLTINVLQIPVGQFRRAAYCSRQGRVLACGLLCRTADEQFLFIISADLSAEILSQLQKFILRAKVRASIPPLRFFADDATPHNDPETLTTQQEITTINGDGWRLYFATDPAAEQLAAHVNVADSLWTCAEINRAIPWISASTQGQFIPQFINWDYLNGIDFDKGCYVGQEIIARLHYLGEVKQRTFRLAGSGTPPPPMTPLLTTTNEPAGAVLSSAAKDDGFVALAAIKTRAAPPFTLNGNPVSDISPPPYQPPDKT